MKKNDRAISDSKDFVHRARVQSIRMICILCASASILGAFGGIDSIDFFIHHLVLAGIFITGFILNHNGRLLWATRFITIATTLWIVEASIGFGEELGLQSFIIIALVAITLFYSHGYYRMISVVAIIVLAALISVYQINYPPLFKLPVTTPYFVFTNAVMPLCIIAIICWNVLAEALANQAVIEEQKKALQESVQFKDRVFSIIGHDLRAPFNSTKSLIELIENDYLTEAEKKEALNELKKGISVSMQTLDNILGWASQGYYGAQLNTKTKMEPLNLHNMVEHVKALFAQTATMKQVTLVNDIPPATYVQADLEQISFVLRNLASNALKFSYAGQNVVFSASKNADRTVVSVIDKGVGMTQDMLSSLFQITTRFSKEGTTNEKGTGLGLIFCKEFVENNKGDMWLESQPGSGTTVNISLATYN